MAIGSGDERRTVGHDQPTGSRVGRDKPGNTAGATHSYHVRDRVFPFTDQNHSRFTMHEQPVSTNLAPVFQIGYFPARQSLSVITSGSRDRRRLGYQGGAAGTGSPVVPTWTTPSPAPVRRHNPHD
ncbi:hypothetical protein Aca07nite_67580 [Actinoplanes capillaceus]|uniref:Uncharacterized protein n=1 Tax=Actinoplanes campanulatus TaxID=113559 RepID=A0ABQ3WT74_9ACTN|nr:hypothetical protein Aca07nite_67580 [Actinoplanes capillaceus]